MSFEGPLFLVGMPRSGTKLLRDLLNSHPSVGIPEIETEFLPWLVKFASRYGDLSHPANFRRLYDAMSRHTYFRLQAARKGVTTAYDWQRNCENFGPAGLFEALVRNEVHVAPGSGRIWGDKSPSYIGHLPLLWSLYPHARVIHIIRDVRDYCLSIHKAWGKDMDRAAQRWTDDVGAARAWGLARGAGYLEVRYEDLIRGPAQVLGGVCRFIGVDFRESMLKLDRPAENRGDTRGVREIVAGNSGKYFDRMTRPALARIERTAGHVMEDLGYELALLPQTPKRLSRATLLIAQFKDGWNLMRTASGSDEGVHALRFHTRYFRTTRGHR